MRARYIIRHHPGLMTEIIVETEGQGEKQIEDRFSLFDSTDYVRRSCEGRGLAPFVFERPDHNTYIAPWITLT